MLGWIILKLSSDLFESNVTITSIYLPFAHHASQSPFMPLAHYVTISDLTACATLPVSLASSPTLQPWSVIAVPMTAILATAKETVSLATVLPTSEYC